MGLFVEKVLPLFTFVNWTMNDDVDDDDESLNEDDDYEEDDINDDEDIPHLIMCQFDYVRFISSLLHILHNNDGVIKPILFTS